MLWVFFFGCCLGLLALAGGSISGGALCLSNDFFGASGEGADFFSQNVSFIRKSEVCRSLCSIGKGIIIGINNQRRYCR